MTIMLLYIATGIFGGFLAGLLGLGGGVVVVIALDWIFTQTGMPANHIMHMAVATSLAVMILTTQSSVRHHQKAGNINWELYRQLIPGIVIGTIVGVIVASFLDNSVMRTFFGICIFLIALKMLFIVKVPPSRQLPGRVGIYSVSSLIGAQSGFLGLGGGIILIPFLAHCNVPLRQTIGMSAICSLTVALIATMSSISVSWNVSDLPAWSTGFIYWPAVAAIALPSVLLVPFGAWCSNRLPVNLLQRVFAVFLLCSGIHMLWPFIN
ncbi:MAG: sulfite exporter TauE/SafE family protein [Proteobacteria bacterium]|nr:sulfite exporter TauE/SafE family protein [Pseudomonadota bacterium]